MLVYYSGWAYFEWASPFYTDTDAETKYVASRTDPKEVSDIFELPTVAQREIKYNKKTITRYLLLSKYTEDVCIPDQVDIALDIANDEDEKEYIRKSVRLVLCENWENNYRKRYEEREEPIVKEVIFTENDIFKVGNDVSFEIPTETERNTMLKLILGMAMDAYGYDPTKRRNTATGENNGSINVAIGKCGLSVDADTVRKYLTEAAERNPDAKPRKT